MKKAVIFDMDGLMIDSERVTYNEYVRKLHMLGHDDFTEELYKDCLGKNKVGICQVLLIIMEMIFQWMKSGMMYMFG